MRQGERTDLQPSANVPKVSQAEAAKMVGVSGRKTKRPTGHPAGRMALIYVARLLNYLFFEVRQAFRQRVLIVEKPPRGLLVADVLDVIPRSLHLRPVQQIEPALAALMQALVRPL
jgi:hypothetical protein